MWFQTQVSVYGQFRTKLDLARPVIKKRGKYEQNQLSQSPSAEQFARQDVGIYSDIAFNDFHWCLSSDVIRACL